MPADPTASWAWRQLRRRRLAAAAASAEPCVRCGRPIDYNLRGNTRWGPTVDHLDARAHGGRLIVPLEELGPAHNRCNSRHGARISHETGRRPRKRPRAGTAGAERSFLPGVGAAPAPAPAVFPPAPPDSAGVDLAPPRWAGELPDPPESACWPRLMTARPARVTGSYGPQFVAWCQRQGYGLRWWQQLVAHRLLEADGEGELVWFWAIVSTARQVGKSHLMRRLLEWRMQRAARLGGPPLLIVHTGQNVSICLEIQRPVLAWAKAAEQKQAGWRTRETNGQCELVDPHGSRWLVRSQQAVYGLTCGLAWVDEGHRVKASAVDAGLEPTMVEVPGAQGILTSTAHSRPTTLMPARRADAIDHLADPDDTLLLEWSAAEDAADDDRTAWRMASPHWTPRRERRIASALTRALRGETDEASPEESPINAFRSQWLNRWPVRRKTKGWVTEDEWAAMADPSPPPKGGVAVLSVEVHRWNPEVLGVACVVKAGDDVKWVDSAQTDLRGAWAWLDAKAAQHRGAVLMPGMSLRKLVPVRGRWARVEPVGAQEMVAATAQLVADVKERRIRHTGETVLAEQMTRSILRPVSTTDRGGRQGSVIADPSNGSLEVGRCVTWAIWGAHQRNRRSFVV